MAATLDSKSNITFTNVDIVSWAHTLGGGLDLVLVVFIGQAGGLQPVTTVTYGAQNLSQVPSSRATGTITASELWQLADGVPPSGNQTITVTMGNVVELTCGAIVAKDASQGTPVFGTVTSVNTGAGVTAVSGTVSSGTDELSMCAFHETIGTRGITTDTGTEAWNQGITGLSQGAGSYITGSASAVHNWTSSTGGEWCLSGVSIKAKAFPSPLKSSNRITLMRSGIATFPAELDVNTWYRSLVECLRMVFA